MPSLQESTTPAEVDYVNTDIINDLIKEDNDDLEICQKENVCNIKIKGDLDNNKKPKRSASSVSSTKITPHQIKANDKASRLLGIDEHVVVNVQGLDSGRFSMGSSLSPANEKKSLINDNLLKNEDRTKFKSLGDLHMEKGLPTVLVNHTASEADEESKTSLLKACHKMLKNTKKLIARETKTLEITPTKTSKSRSSLPGGQKQTLQLISHTTFPGLPTYPVLAASHSSPWNC